ncbi:MAG: ABC transporter ATP-binding protein [bacterium]|nr:ABC transporter ATP-binding protein [bacterium]
MDPLIEVSNLRYRYDDGTVALNGVDFRLFAGETVALLGANGSGKTTFVLHLNGLLRGEGEISVCGLRVERKHLREIRARIGLLFQDPDEQLFMPTVLEDVAFGPLSHGLDPRAAETEAREALNRVGMSHAAGKAPYHLSAGEKRRVALAGLLAMEPEILVLDEPTTYLDPPGQKDLLHLLEGLPQSKIIVTHDTWFVRILASRAVFFEAGKIAGDGSVDEIIHRFQWQIPMPGSSRRAGS